jgi:hypothetical protein
MFLFMSGLITAGYVLAGLFFLRFWARTRDRLFVVFATAFWLLAAQQAALAFIGTEREEHTWLYLVRLVAFLLIIGAVIRKNRNLRTS